jgi:hypothetical protein
VLKGHNSSVTHLDFGVILKSSASLANELVGDKGIEYKEFVEDFDLQTLTIMEHEIIKTFQTDFKGQENNVKCIEEKKIKSRVLEKNDICIQSTSECCELFFWCADGNRIQSASALKDAWWASFSCPYGWPVQGILSLFSCSSFV